VTRLAQNPSLIHLTEVQLHQMTDYCRQHDDVLALYLYGSYGTPYQTPLSDVDLAILPMPGVQWGIHHFLDVISELTRCGENDDINVINLHEVPVNLQFRVLETGIPLFCRDEIVLADFAEWVVKRHADFAPDLRVIYQDFDAAVRREFL